MVDARALAHDGAIHPVGVGHGGPGGTVQPHLKHQRTGVGRRARRVGEADRDFDQRADGKVCHSGPSWSAGSSENGVPPPACVLAVRVPTVAPSTGRSTPARARPGYCGTTGLLKPAAASTAAARVIAALA